MCVEEEDPFDDIVGSECDTDEDCPVDFLCEQIEIGCGTVPDCPPCVCAGCDPDDEDCTEDPECECPDCPEPEPCDDEVVGMCVFSPAECEVDEDCGEGFECVEIEECWGGGSSGDCMCSGCVCAECPEGEECPPCDCPEDPVCECEDEDDYEEECETLMAVCLPQEIECEVDTDCPEGFVCYEFSDMVTCDCACSCLCEEEDEENCPPCDCGECDCGEEESEFYCFPEGWDEEYFGGDGGGSIDTGEETPDPQDPVNGDDKEEGEDPEPDADEPEGEADEEPDDVPEGDADDDGAGEAGGGESGADDGGSTGCSAGATSASGFPMVLIAFAALALAAIRRRRSGSRPA